MSEALEAKRDGAVLQKNSGRGQTNKGDATIKPYCTLDFKEYSSSFNFTPKMWNKVCTDNFKNGTMFPVLKLVFGKENEKTRVCCIPESAFHDYIRLLKLESEGVF